ncbi:wax ester/triacylglycerol synthase family O-acyltransferase [Nocardia donostiensis]|uniref:Diacylglycerol O-acyltransferase n=1 Tax=Nocardia donostiensis TaxID=1538463 RepID=A0A1V2TLB1_9NOCA|nr:wax ester/triacylglycerol synthase family O-acyltransferase [Nocardia donostiensis]ONM50141.1 diacylglycerol O-acyltransferase [Nocardia donostiensis]OQS15803.1 diacylglycerol O-acyltransferase [Nocardia donostiensis]OQS23608.1 diacylglycerol O-acyltransferase [Nocardia donostiensis]
MSTNIIGAASGEELQVTQVTIEQLQPRDAVFVYDEFDRHPSNIVAVYVFDAADAAEPVDAPRIVSWVSARLGYAQLFRRRLRRVPLDLDLPYWVPDTAFDVGKHVLIGEPESGWDEVRRRLGDIAAQRLDLALPPWQIHVFPRVHGVPGAPGAAATIMVLKFHHSACDGVATRELELKLFGGGACPPAAADGAPVWSAPPVFARAVGVFPYRFARFVAGVRRTRSAAQAVRRRVDADRIHEPSRWRPATRFNRRIGSGPTVGLVTIPLPEVLTAKARCADHVTVNDVMLTIVSGALAAYLAENGELPAESLAAMVPMSMRGIADWNSANQLCQMSVDLHTDIADPHDRLMRIRRSVRWEKQRNSDDAVLRRESRVQTSPAWLLRLAGWARAQQPYDNLARVPLNNTTISNVAPVGNGLAFCGAPLIRVFGVLPTLDGDGLRHLITSQGDEIVISYSVDPAMMPDPDHYGELLLRSFRELVDALQAGGS